MKTFKERPYKFLVALLFLLLLIPSNTIFAAGNKGKQNFPTQSVNLTGNQINSLGQSLNSFSDDLAYGWDFFIRGLLLNIKKSEVQIKRLVVSKENGNINVATPPVVSNNKEVATIVEEKISTTENPSAFDSGYSLSPSTIINNLKGEKGDKGEKGPQGPIGPKGEDGKDIDPNYFVSQELFRGQVDKIFDSITKSMKGLADSLKEKVETNLLLVSGNATVEGDLTIVGNLIGNVAGTINPSFAIGSIPFQGANGLIDNNTNFFWDATNSRLGIGTNSPTAALHLKAGTATAGTAPLKFTSGTNLSTGETGAMEYDGTNLYFTPTGTTRKTIAYLTDIPSPVTLPITIVNSSNLFSTGLTGTGSGVTSTTYSIFLGQDAGNSATSANNSNFLGNSAGYSATNAASSNFLGFYAGNSATNASNSNFLGLSAGYQATSANNSNFLGYQAGRAAINASYSNFLGYQAGYQDTSAPYSNFLGYQAGYQATSANYSNFLGNSAGYQATSANNSNFLGPFAGNSATNAFYSNFLGLSAGYQATSANNSNFLGYEAGYSATNAINSNFLGNGAGYQATSASSSNFLGDSAGRNATSASYSNFLGYRAGRAATSASNSNFLGQSAGFFANSAPYSNFLGYKSGYQAFSSSNSNFLGQSAGYLANSAPYSNFLGYYSGYQATSASNSNFLGYYSGYQATSASYSNFLGQSAGQSATSASNSNFLGYEAGYSATNASYSNFLGAGAGSSATNAYNSIFIGKSAGLSDTVNNTGNSNNFSILIGPNTNTGGFSNSIALGGYATNTKTNQLTLGSPTRPITSLYVAGVDYTLPTSQGGNGTVLTNDGNGGLTWASGGGGGGSSQWTTINNDIYYNNGNVGIGTDNPTALLVIEGQSQDYTNRLIFGGDSYTGYNYFQLNTHSSIDGDQFGRANMYIDPETGFYLELNSEDYSLRNTIYLTQTYTNFSNQIGSYFYNDSYSGGQLTKIGDVDGNNNLTRLVINDVGRVINLGMNESDGADGIEGLQINLDGGSPVVKIGSTGFYGNNTLFTINDTNQNFSFMNGNVGIGTDNPTAKLDIKLGTNIIYNQTFNGSGLDDITYSGIYNGSIFPNYIYVDLIGEGNPDTFSYYDDQGDCSGNDIPITGSLQYLCDGISITFDSTTGHTEGAEWIYEVNITSSENNPVFNIGDGFNNYFTVNAITDNSNFLGNSAGYQATHAYNSNFLGQHAGYQATSAASSNFLGYYAGYQAISANNSNFLGNYAGYQATSANNSNFLGYQSGYQATSASNSNFLGLNAGLSATSANNSNFLGISAGYQATSANNSNFLGNSAGSSATSANNSNFLGQTAGYLATNAYNSNFLGQSAGLSATNAYFSNFLGYSAGLSASNADSSNFIGYFAGYQATAAYSSNFLGVFAGRGATYAYFSNFLGQFAGYQDTAASYSNLFGYQVGKFYTGNNIGSNNIIIGTNISLPNNTANAMNLGGVLFATGTYSTTTGNPSITAVSGGRVGIGAVSPSTILEIGSADLGNGVAGPIITLGRNTNAANTGAGSINFLSKAGTNGYVWQDAAGKLRINTSSPSNANDTAGNVIGDQTSTRETKVEIVPYTNYDQALSLVVNAPLNTFRYIKEIEGYGSDSPLAKTRIGFIADEVDRMFMVGNSIDQVSVNGLLMASIKELDLKLKDMSSYDMESATSFGSLIKNFLAEGIILIKEMTTNLLRINGDVCVDDVCVTKEQFKQMLINAQGTSTQNTNEIVSPTEIIPEVINDSIDPEIPMESGQSEVQVEENILPEVIDPVISPPTESL